MVGLQAQQKSSHNLALTGFFHLFFPCFISLICFGMCSSVSAAGRSAHGGERGVRIDIEDYSGGIATVDDDDSDAALAAALAESTAEQQCFHQDDAFS